MQVFKIGQDKMIYFLIIGIIFIVCLGVWLAIENQNYIDNYNKRYIEKIKQNVARSLVNPHRAQRKPYIAKGKKWLRHYY